MLVLEVRDFLETTGVIILGQLTNKSVLHVAYGMGSIERISNVAAKKIQIHHTGLAGSLSQSYDNQDNSATHACKVSHNHVLTAGA